MKKIFVAGHNGMVGAAICRQLKHNSNVALILRDRKQLDLCDQAAVMKFIKEQSPDEIIIAAARVGGIHANSNYPAEFIFQNLQIQNNLIHAAHLANVDKLLFLGSSCIYPKMAKQPIIENCLLTGELEATNEPYAIAKIAGIKMCEGYNRQYGRDYRSVMPTNLYGPGDNYHIENSHVIPALIKRFHYAKRNNLDKVVIWGTGKPMREFLYVDDMAAASLFVLQLPKAVYQSNTAPSISHINIGTGQDITIKDLSGLISQVVGFSGKIEFDNSKPDGTPRKLLDTRLLNKLGFRPKTELLSGLIQTYADFLKNEFSHREK